MALSASALTNLISSGVLGLSALLGAHSSASSAAQTPLAMIKANAGNPAEAAVVAQNAQLIATMFASSNPAAASTALAIAASPSSALSLVGTLEQEINSGQNSIMTYLAHSVLSGAAATTAA